MQEPQQSSSLSRAMANQVTKNWEAYGNKEIIFYQHLEPFDKAQEMFSKMVALDTIGAVRSEQIEATRDFLVYFIKSLLKVRIKMEKYQKLEDDITFTKWIDYAMNMIINGKWEEIPFLDFSKALFKIGRIYERLGYSSPERERTRTTLQSDMELPNIESTPEYMINPPSELDYSKTKLENDELLE